MFNVTSILDAMTICCENHIMFFHWDGKHWIGHISNGQQDVIPDVQQALEFYLFGVSTGHVLIRSSLDKILTVLVTEYTRSTAAVIYDPRTRQLSASGDTNRLRAFTHYGVTKHGPA